MMNNFKYLLNNSTLTPFYNELKFRSVNRPYLFRNYDDNLLKSLGELRDSITPAEISDKKKILFVTGYGLGSHYYNLELLLKLSIFQKGHSTISLFCDKSVPCCEFSSDSSSCSFNTKPFKFSYGLTSKVRDYKCDACTSNVTTLLDCLGLPYESLKSFTHDSFFENGLKIANNYDYNNFRDVVCNGIKIGEEAYASILRATFVGDCTPELKNDELVKQYLLSAYLQSCLYQKAFEAIKPDAVVLIHGIYQIHGIATKVANKLSIPTFVLGGGGIRKNTAIVCQGETYHHQLVNEPNEIWNRRVLTKDEIDKVLQYATLKRTDGQSVDYLNYHPNPINDLNVIKSKLEIEKYDRVVSFYTNVLWDAQIIYSSNVFKNIIDAINKTIDIISKNEKVLLLIRIHPAEVKSSNPSRQKISEEINKNINSKSKNINIIEAESDISSYKLAEISHVNVIYGTKMGLEMAIMKRNLLICGESFSRNKGYGTDIIDINQFENELMVNNPSEKELAERYNIAIKYAYYLYFERMIDIPIESTSDQSGSFTRPILNKHSLTHPGVEKIVNSIIYNKSSYFNYK